MTVVGWPEVTIDQTEDIRISIRPCVVRDGADSGTSAADEKLDRRAKPKFFEILMRYGILDPEVYLPPVESWEIGRVGHSSTPCDILSECQLSARGSSEGTKK